MGLQDYFARRRSDQRIRRRAKSSLVKQNHFGQEDRLEAAIGANVNRAYRVGVKLYNGTQARKGQGKQLFIAGLKRGIGVTSRTVLGPPPNWGKKKKVHK